MALHLCNMSHNLSQPGWSNRFRWRRADPPSCKSPPFHTQVALYLCNPNNPTGTCVETNQLKDLILSAAAR